MNKQEEFVVPLHTHTPLIIIKYVDSKTKLQNTAVLSSELMDTVGRGHVHQKWVVE